MVPCWFSGQSDILRIVYTTTKCKSTKSACWWFHSHPYSSRWSRFKEVRDDFCSFSLKPDKFLIFLNYFFDLSYSAKYQTGRTAWTKNSKAFGVFSLLQTKWGRGSFDEAIGASRRMEERETDFWIKDRRAWRNSESRKDEQYGP